MSKKGANTVVPPRQFEDEDKSPQPSSQALNREGTNEKFISQSIEHRLEEAGKLGGAEVCKQIEKLLKQVQSEELTIGGLQKIIQKSRGTWKEELKIKNVQTCNGLIGGALPLFSKALAKGSLIGLHDLLKLTLLYKYEAFPQIEKHLAGILDLFTKMLQVPPSTKDPNEQEHNLSQQVQRLVLLNLSNLLAPGVGARFQNELQLVLKRIYELILHFSGLLSNSSNQLPILQLIATLLRNGNSVLIELKDNKQFFLDSNYIRLTEKVFARVFKLLFLGNPVFHPSLFGGPVSTSISEINSLPQKDTSFSSIYSLSSQSEWSESDDLSSHGDKSKVEQVQSKIRSHTCLIIQTIIKQFPSVLRNQWQLLLKSTDFSKDFIASLFQKKEFNSKSNNTIETAASWQNNYAEPSLLSCAILEENSKVKANVLTTICVVIEVFQTRQLLSGLEIQKIEKSNSGFKTQAFLIFSAYRNLHFTLIHLLSIDDNPQLISSVLKVYLSLLTFTPQFEKMPFNEGVGLLFDQIIQRVLLHNSENNLNNTEPSKNTNKESISGNIATANDNRFPSSAPFGTLMEYLHTRFNAFQAISQLAKSSSAFPELASSYLLGDQGVISQCLREANSKVLRQRGIIESQEDTLREMIALECIHLLSTLQKHYLSCLFSDETEKEKYQIWRQIKQTIDDLENEKNIQPTTPLSSSAISVSSKRLTVMYELIEKIAEEARNIISGREIEDEQFNGDCEIQEDQGQELSQLSVLAQQTTREQCSEFCRIELSIYIINKIKQLLLEVKGKENLTEEQNGMLACGISLSRYVSDESWQENLEVTQLVKSILIRPVQPPLRFYVFRTMSALTFIPSFSFRDVPFYLNMLSSLLIYHSQLQSANNKSANLAVFSKLSQTFANWCYNFQEFSSLPAEVFPKLLNTLAQLAESPKEKISPHGLRALGIFLMKVTQDQFDCVIGQIKCSETSKSTSNKQTGVYPQDLAKLIAGQLTHKSPKIVWNACIAVANSFKNSNSFAFKDQNSVELLARSLQKVLVASENEKSQLCALRAIQSLLESSSFEMILDSNAGEILLGLTEIGSATYIFQALRLKSSSFNSKSLGEQVVQVLVDLISKLYNRGGNKNIILAEFIKNKSFSVLELLGKHLYQLWKYNRLDFHLSVKQEEAFEDDEKQIFNYKQKEIQNDQVVKQDALMETPVKGQEEFKTVVFDFKCISIKEEILRNELKKLKEVAQILQQIIDENDDLCVSLAVYDHIKEYASTDVNTPIVKFYLL